MGELRACGEQRSAETRPSNREVPKMPCQCSTAAIAASETDAMRGGCECGTESSEACGCGSDGTPTPSDAGRSLERVVMELDKRLRRLEATR